MSGSNRCWSRRGSWQACAGAFGGGQKKRSERDLAQQSEPLGISFCLRIILDIKLVRKESRENPHTPLHPPSPKVISYITVVQCTEPRHSLGVMLPTRPDTFPFLRVSVNGLLRPGSIESAPPYSLISDQPHLSPPIWDSLPVLLCFSSSGYSSRKLVRNFVDAPPFGLVKCFLMITVRLWIWGGESPTRDISTR